jgi:hypothetical protein
MYVFAHITVLADVDAKISSTHREGVQLLQRLLQRGHLARLLTHLLQGGAHDLLVQPRRALRQSSHTSDIRARGCAALLTYVMLNYNTALTECVGKVQTLSKVKSHAAAIVC